MLKSYKYKFKYNEKYIDFKTDKLGDLINISQLISNLKNSYPKSEITLICSNYNYSVANLYSNELKILVYKKPILFLLSNFKKLILKI